MLNAADIADNLTGLVGWHADSAITLPPALLESRSDLYMQDASELLTLDILRHIAPRTEAVGPWLLRLQADALKRLVTSLRQEQNLNGKVLLSSGEDAEGNPIGLYMGKGPGRRDDTVNKLSRFVGVQLTPYVKRGVSFSVPSVKMQFDAVLSAGLTLYLYQDGEPDPLATVMVLAESKAYFPFPVDLSDFPALKPGVRYWLGYYEDDLPLGVRAIQTTVGPCGCVDDPYDLWNKQVRVQPFAVPFAALETDRTLFDPAQVSLEGQNYGLNLSFLSYCDIAAMLNSQGNRNLLAPVVQQAIAVRLYEAIVSSPNVTSVSSRPDIHTDAQYLLFTAQAKLYGGKVPGTDAVYPSALKSLKLDLSGLDSACGPPVYSPLSMGSLSTRN